MVHYDADVRELAAWLEAQGPRRLWAVDGEQDLAGKLSFPSTSEDLSHALREHGGMIRVYAPPGNELPLGKPLTRENFDAVAERSDDARAFTLAWIDGGGAGESWDLVEDAIASELAAPDEFPRSA